MRKPAGFAYNFKVKPVDFDIKVGYNGFMAKQISIRFDDDLHDWLTERVAAIRPETTINKYINWLVEQDRERESARLTYEQYEQNKSELFKGGLKLSNDGQWVNMSEVNNSE